MLSDYSQSKQPDLWAVEFITFAAATVFISLRLLSRRLTKIEFWWDDYLAMCAYVSYINGTVEYRFLT